MKRLLKIFWHVVKSSLNSCSSERDDKGYVQVTPVLGEVSKVRGQKKKTTSGKSKND